MVKEGDVIARLETATWRHKGASSGRPQVQAARANLHAGHRPNIDDSQSGRLARAGSREAELHLGVRGSTRRKRYTRRAP